MRARSRSAQVRARCVRWRSSCGPSAPPDCSPSLLAAPAAARSSPAAVRRSPAGPDAVMSDNVEYLGSIKQDVGLTTGARMIDDRLFVTSGKNISIYDISDPASPQPLGGIHTNSRGRTRRCRPTARCSRSPATSTPSGPRVRRGAGARRLRPVLRRPRPGEHQAGRRGPDRQPHRRMRARLPVLLRPAGHDHRRARRPRRHGADGDRRLDPRARATQGVDASRAATTSARSARESCSPPASRSP